MWNVDDWDTCFNWPLSRSRFSSRDSDVGRVVVAIGGGALHPAHCEVGVLVGVWMEWREVINRGPVDVWSKYRNLSPTRFGFLSVLAVQVVCFYCHPDALFWSTRTYDNTCFNAYAQIGAIAYSGIEESNVWCDNLQFRLSVSLPEPV